MSEDFDDILGSPAPLKRGRGRPRKDAAPNRNAAEMRLRATLQAKPAKAAKKEKWTAAERAVIDRFLVEAQPRDLPERVREGFWNAKIKELRYRTLAGELWSTESVMEVLGDTFQLLASKMKLFSDELEEVTELSEKQRKMLMSMCDNLTRELREELIDRAQKQHTESYVAELDAE